MKSRNIADKFWEVRFRVIEYLGMHYLNMCPKEHAGKIIPSLVEQMAYETNKTISPVLRNIYTDSKSKYEKLWKDQLLLLKPINQAKQKSNKLEAQKRELLVQEALSLRKQLDEKELLQAASDEDEKDKDSNISRGDLNEIDEKLTILQEQLDVETENLSFMEQELGNQ